MFFFFKPTTLNLDCFTSRTQVYEFCPVDYTYNFFPDWWKTLPKEIKMHETDVGTSTIKMCSGFNNFHANGVTIPLWSDLSIDTLKTKTSAEVKWEYSDRISTLGRHDFGQIGDYLDRKKYFHLKLISPWQFTCKEKVNFVWVQNNWSLINPDEIIIPPAIIEYKYQSTTNINLFGKFGVENKPKKIIIEAGKPLVNIIPMTEKKLKLHTHLVDDNELEKIAYKGAGIKFKGNYNFKKMVQQEKEKKCPFR